METNTDDILFKCIEKYEEILKNDYTYKLDGGIIIKIIFKKSNFAHLLGLHKLDDIPVFKSLSDKDGNVKKGQAEIVYREIKLKRIKYDTIVNSAKFDLIKDRIESFVEINTMLLFSEVIVNFDSKKFKEETKMDTLLKSNVIFFNKIKNTYFHLCIVNKDGKTYPESFFVRNDNNYTRGQKKKLILEKRIESHNNKSGTGKRSRKNKQAI